ncbi:MAG: hypothetical protein KGJ62_01195 [Armatimonadetes bacterium]|nr:hypothetical protein [Armatimonadota bacterium]MDE2207908.1 hypothetical protein [Armatimonadota bacterium]
MTPYYSPRSRSLITCIALLALTSTAQAAAPPRHRKAGPANMQSAVLKNVHWRSVGPASMGGRIADIARDPGNPFTFYVAMATGGLIKTENDGASWTPVFTHEPVGSVGAVAVAPSDSKLIWVGTGEANNRNSSSWGDGVYKSTDGGATWVNMGLKETQEIARVVIDPNDPNLVYVAAMGHLWGTNKERGLYVTRNGGKTWDLTLAPGPETGCTDIALGAPGSHIVYAATYQRIRHPWDYEGLGDQSGIWKSTDSGATWKRVTAGLPPSPLGRIGIAVAASNPKIVYAVVESDAGGATDLFDINSKHGGVFRSDDAGDTFKRVSGTDPRPFYFSQIRVDPTDPNRVYVLGFNLSVSTDGGKTFAGNGSPGVHSDLHALWIDPRHPQHLMLGTDGGLYISKDQCKTWDFINNFPMGEFYHAVVDDQTPYNIYGGLQDNGSWYGPSAKQGFAGPDNSDWKMLEDSDGSFVAVDPTNNNIVYAEGQGADVSRVDLSTHKRVSLHPMPPEGDQAYRFNWNSPLAISHFDHDTVYLAGNRLFKYTKAGTEWTVISPDLSRQIGPRITGQGSGAETYGTITAIAESPIKKGLIWAGTDDGNVWVTRDDGTNWTKVSTSLPEQAQRYWLNAIVASRYYPGRAYIAVDGHRSDNMRPYAFTTDDYGATWRNITGNLPSEGVVQAICEDPVNPDLLFAGTEFGAWVSFDRGARWHKLGANLPTVAVDDIVIQPRMHALIAATHGRSVWVIDNIAPLEAITADTKAASVMLFPLTPGDEYLPVFGGFGNEPRVFTAQNREAGIPIVFWMQSQAASAPNLTIADARGHNVATLSSDVFAGLKTVTWDLRRGSGAPPRRRFGGGGGGPGGAPPAWVRPGEYTVTLKVGQISQSQKVQVSGDPALSEPAAPQLAGRIPIGLRAR